MSVEKLLVVGVLAAIIIGPKNLPGYAEKLAVYLRGLREFTAMLRQNAERELGAPIEVERWSAQIRQYDPRQIAKDVWAQPVPGTPESAATTPVPTAPAEGPTAEAGVAAEAGVVAVDADAGAGAVEREPLAMVERWVVVGGSSGHPRLRKILVPAERGPAVEPIAPDGPDDPAVPTGDGTTDRLRTRPEPTTVQA